MKVGILTSGGDCQSLNAAIRGLAKALYHMSEDTELIGFENGYHGLIYGEYRRMEPADFSGILKKGGTILGTSGMSRKSLNRQGDSGFDRVEAMKNNYYEAGLDCLVIFGGNGSQEIAELLCEEGLNIISLPKNIDNGLWGTEETLGFCSAVETAAEAIDSIHTTAASHGRVFIVEIMGHKTGWLTLYAGLAGGADIILIPEIPYDMEAVTAAVKKRLRMGKKFAVLAVAEGAVSKEEAEAGNVLKRQAWGAPFTAYEISSRIRSSTGCDVRVTVPGHMLRGGEPSAYDRALATRLGAEAAAMVLRGDYGYMAAVKNGTVEKILLSEVIGRLKKIDPKASVIQEARAVGICFGDEKTE